MLRNHGVVLLRLLTPFYNFKKHSYKVLKLKTTIKLAAQQTFLIGLLVWNKLLFSSYGNDVAF